MTCVPHSQPQQDRFGGDVSSKTPTPTPPVLDAGLGAFQPPRTHSPGSRGGDGVGPSSGPGPGLPPRLLRTLSGQAATRTPPGAVAYGQAFELGGGPLTHGQRPLRPGHGPQDVNMLALELLDVKEVREAGEKGRRGWLEAGRWMEAAAMRRL